MFGRIVVPVLLLLFGFGAIQFARASDEIATIEGSSGTLTIDGVDYDFAATTCLISEDDFVAAGTGFDGQNQFWVSASSGVLDLSVGTENDIDKPEDNQLWLVNQEPVDWHVSNETVMAKAPVSDQRSPNSDPTIASLRLRCGGV